MPEALAIDTNTKGEVYMPIHEFKGKEKLPLDRLEVQIALQKLLGELGFYKHGMPLDGAIKSFQTAVGEKPTGEVIGDLYDVLKAINWAKVPEHYITEKEAHTRIIKILGRDIDLSKFHYDENYRKQHKHPGVADAAKQFASVGGSMSDAEGVSFPSAPKTLSGEKIVKS